MNSGAQAARVPNMKRRREKNPLSEGQRRALEESGGEPLEGSGFESEEPEPDFSDSEAPAEPPRS